MPGPAPKRSQQRRRRNAVKVDEAPNAIDRRGPDPEGLSGLAFQWYESLRVSGQSVYYTASDWTTALVVAKAIETFEAKPTATLLTAILSGASSLAATEGDRRRLRIELERADMKETQADVSEFDEYRAKLRQSS